MCWLTFKPLKRLIIGYAGEPRAEARRQWKAAEAAKPCGLEHTWPSFPELLFIPLGANDWERPTDFAKLRPLGALFRLQEGNGPWRDRAVIVLKVDVRCMVKYQWANYKRYTTNDILPCC